MTYLGLERSCAHRDVKSYSNRTARIHAPNPTSLSMECFYTIHITMSASHDSERIRSFVIANEAVINPTILGSNLQSLSHKFPFCKAQPPLTRHTCAIGVDPVQQSRRQLLSHLHNILSQNFGLVSIRRRFKSLVERETGVTWYGEVGVECNVHNSLDNLDVSTRTFHLPFLHLHSLTTILNQDEMFLSYLLSIPLPNTRLYFRQYLAHKQDTIDQHTIGRALDLKVAKESVGAEE
jgi:hypothetical protein